jgi:hypothetical protein
MELVSCIRKDQREDVAAKSTPAPTATLSPTVNLTAPEPVEDKKKKGPSDGLICAYITGCFSEMIEEHSQLIHRMARRGVLCFKNVSMEETELSIEHAMLLKRLLAALSSLKLRWEELAINLLETMSGEACFYSLDQTYYCSKASDRLQTAFHLLQNGVAEQLSTAALQNDKAMVEKLDELSTTLKELKLGIRILEQAATAQFESSASPNVDVDSDFSKAA